jgi:hypothetical protein
MVFTSVRLRVDLFFVPAGVSGGINEYAQTAPHYQSHQKNTLISYNYKENLKPTSGQPEEKYSYKANLYSIC